MLVSQRSVGRSVGQLVVYLVGLLVGWLVGWLVGCSVGRSIGRLIGGKEANHNKTPMTLPTRATPEKARDPSYNIMLTAGAINIGEEEETNDMELEGGDTNPLRGLSLNEKFLEKKTTWPTARVGRTAICGYR